MVPFYMETRTANQQVAALYKREWRVVYFNVSRYHSNVMVNGDSVQYEDSEFINAPVEG